MLVVEKINDDVIKVRNLQTGTPMTLPVHWLEVSENKKEGDVIKIIKDEVNTKRRRKNGKYKKKKLLRFDPEQLQRQVIYIIS